MKRSHFLPFLPWMGKRSWLPRHFQLLRAIIAGQALSGCVCDSCGRVAACRERTCLPPEALWHTKYARKSPTTETAVFGGDQCYLISPDALCSRIPQKWTLTPPSGSGVPQEISSRDLPLAPNRWSATRVWAERRSLHVGTLPKLKKVLFTP
jgi:hypothetical protein